MNGEMVDHGFIAGQLGAHVYLNCFLPQARNSNTAPFKNTTTTEQQGGGEHQAPINYFGSQLFMQGNNQQ
jgi:hypothetical protein